MTKEVAKAINAVSVKINEISRNIDNFFGQRCDTNAKSIIAAEQSLTDMDLQSIETEQTLTDMDLRILELEDRA